MACKVSRLIASVFRRYALPFSEPEHPHNERRRRKIRIFLGVRSEATKNPGESACLAGASDDQAFLRKWGIMCRIYF
jgi:hypothetical protein